MNFLQKAIRIYKKYFNYFSRIFLLLYKNKKRTNHIYVVTAISAFFLYIFLVFFIPPLSFPDEQIISIPKGASLQETADSFKQKNVIRSSFWFSVLVRIMGGERSFSAGDYFFSHPYGIPKIAYMVTVGDFGLKPLKVRLQEGVSRVDMATKLAKRFRNFNSEKFLNLTKNKEGYLFPDTYYFLPNISEKKIADSLEKTFYKKIKIYQKDIENSGRSLKDIITMASLIEKEAYTSKSRRIISGILWERIKIGMPLQVDVTFDYINGKNTFELTQKDLDIDSLYNTYKYTGLPPGPIGSPSLDSIEAAIFPTKTDYLYFLADKKGNVHYSVTFKEHRGKKFLYLR